MGWYLDQWSQIKVGGLPILHRKLLTALNKLPILSLFMLNAVWAVPAVLFIRIARPLVHVRMGTFWESRIGHFVVDPSIFLVRHHLKLAKERTIDLFWFPERTCNEQWAKMVRRQLFVRWWVRYLVGFNKLIPGGASHDLPRPSATSSSTYNILARAEVCFKFTLEEEETAKAWLRRRGWRDGERFVCLLVRDSAYLSSHPLNSNGDGERWSYHNYRDSDIDTYVEAIRALVDRGYWVIRMGKIMHKRLSLQHQRVIDYPFVDDQDDLMDIWLSVNCYFFISTASGPDSIPCIYGKPVVFVNALPLVLGVFWANRIWVPKHLRWQDSGNPLTLKEHCQHCYGQATEYEQARIAIMDLSPSEITAAVLECEQHTAGTWVETDEGRDRQRRYWDTLRSCPNFCSANNSNDIHPQARAGSAWLASVGDAFFD